MRDVPFRCLPSKARPAWVRSGSVARVSMALIGRLIILIIKTNGIEMDHAIQVVRMWSSELFRLSCADDAAAAARVNASLRRRSR